MKYTPISTCLLSGLGTKYGLGEKDEIIPRALNGTGRQGEDR